MAYECDGSDIFGFWRKNLVFAVLGQKWSKIGHFGPKMVILTYFPKSGHRILLVFAIETRFLVLKKWQKNIVSKNLKIDFLALFWSKIGHFSPKMTILTYFSKSNHRILLIFAIETRFLVLKKWQKFFCLEKSENWLFGPFLVNNTLLVVPKWVFRPFLTIFLQSVDVLWSSFVIWTIFMVY